MYRLCFYILFINVFFMANVFAAEKIKVFVSILPQKDFVKQVGKDLVDIEVMVGPGQNPATYEPTPKQMAHIAGATVYFSIGVPFENAWLPKIRKNNKRLIVVDCCDSLTEKMITSHHHAGLDEEISHNDPHVWTSPKKVIQLVEQITGQLISIDNKHEAIYRESSNQFIKRLLDLDNEIRIKTRNLVKRELIVSHPSWSYFAQEYNFIQIPIEQNGKEIQANALVRLINDARRKNIKAVFIQPQFNNKAAEMIAKEIGARLIMLDPLASDYITNMQQVTEKIVEGLSYE